MRPCPFYVGQRVCMKSSLQSFRVVGIEFSPAAGKWMIHAKIGVMHFFQWHDCVEAARG